jgi:hypothetical protein
MRNALMLAIVAAVLVLLSVGWVAMVELLELFKS